MAHSGTRLAHNGLVSVRGTAAHWDEAYALGDTTRSWYRREPEQSLRRFDECAISPDAGVIDVGGGASTLVDALHARGYRDLTVLDISAAGERIARHRLGSAADDVQWIVADVLEWQPDRTFDVWHDRAALHFLVDDDDRRAYLRALDAATTPGSIAIIATFAPDGPTHCSGLPVERYGVDDLALLLGDGWRLRSGEREEHAKPAGAVQPFTWTVFERR